MKKAPKVECAHTVMQKIEEVIPNPRNPNKHSEDQVKLLAKIIEAQGWRSPITVSRRSGFVVRGHCRLLAARHLGLDFVPVDVQDYLNEAVEWADLIADNRLAELADLDMGELKDLLLELDTGDLDMDLTGFTEKELERLMTTDGHEDEEHTIDEPKEPFVCKCPRCGYSFEPGADKEE